MRMAVHPDDPPRPILGLPRIVSTIEDMQWMVETVNSMANGFTMCTGSYGVRADNDLVDMIKQFGAHLLYASALYAARRESKTFHEAAHLHGDVDMYEVVKAIVEEEHRRKAEGSDDLIPMRPNARSSDAGRSEEENESGLFRHWPSERACGSPRRRTGYPALSLANNLLSHGATRHAISTQCNSNMPRPEIAGEDVE